MADTPTEEPEVLFSYELDPETETDELDQHRARFAGLSLEHYRVMRAYAAFKAQKNESDKNNSGDPES